MGAQLDEALLLVLAEGAEDLGSVQQVGVGVDLAGVEGEKRGVEEERPPVAIDEEQQGEETLDRCFWQDVLELELAKNSARREITYVVEFVAQINGVDVV